MTQFRMGDIVRVPSRPYEGLFEVVSDTDGVRCNISRDSANSEIKGVPISLLTLVCPAADRKDVKFRG